MRQSARRVTVTDLAYEAVEVGSEPVAVREAEFALPAGNGESPVHSMQRDLERRVQESFGNREAVGARVTGVGARVATVAAAVAAAIGLAALFPTASGR